MKSDTVRPPRLSRSADRGHLGDVRPGDALLSEQATGSVDPLLEISEALTSTVDLIPGLRRVAAVIQRSPGVQCVEILLAGPSVEHTLIALPGGNPAATAMHAPPLVASRELVLDDVSIGRVSAELCSETVDARTGVESLLANAADLIAHSLRLRRLLPTPSPGAASLSELVARYERRLIEAALETTRGNRARAAKLLRTTERILGYRVQRYGIDCRLFRP